MKPKIPKGWRKLRAGEIIRPGDRYWSWGKGPWSGDESYGVAYIPHTARNPIGHHAHIRRIKRKARK